MKSRRQRRSKARRFGDEDISPRPPQQRSEAEAARVLRLLAEIGNPSPMKGDREI